ncbi:hypothetical protein [Curtobacterium sp. PhB115]|uniref:hypothetical protein n=1 Tax=Curtobacterium sp. PhB115 TaxID=2485173 RepID=UPI000FC361C6|nr:hypothetical protein [Curtobacterium sp. PhB115]ROP65415.1 hypothetical protein EDF19_2458 [Curtobacterium sp. PhB115]
MPAIQKTVATAIVLATVGMTVLTGATVATTAAPERTALATIEHRHGITVLIDPDRP